MSSLLLKACLVFLKISVFCFGGGYAALGLIQSEIVDRFAWLSMEEYIDVVAIAEMTPGPIAINAATFVGNRLGGPLGGVLCTLSFVLPPFALALLLTFVFTKVRGNSKVQAAVRGIRPAAIGIIAAAGLSIAKSAFPAWPQLVIFAIAALIVFVWKKSPILALLASGFAGVLIYGVILA